jgi:hypothetical protein
MSLLELQVFQPERTFVSRCVDRNNARAVCSVGRAKVREKEVRKVSARIELKYLRGVMMLCRLYGSRMLADSNDTRYVVEKRNGISVKLPP